MDDARIRQLTEDVLADLRRPASADEAGLAERVVALESAVRGLQAALAPQATATNTTALSTVVTTQMAHASARAHPSFQLLGGPGADGDRCSLEPDKPCVGSGACRTFGH